ncbi:unnamed protein product, partial [Prorocentrum cordatum]
MPARDHRWLRATAAWGSCPRGPRSVTTWGKASFRAAGRYFFLACPPEAATAEYTKFLVARYTWGACAACRFNCSSQGQEMATEEPGGQRGPFFDEAQRLDTVRDFTDLDQGAWTSDVQTQLLSCQTPAPRSVTGAVRRYFPFPLPSSFEKRACCSTSTRSFARAPFGITRPGSRDIFTAPRFRLRPGPGWGGQGQGPPSVWRGPAPQLGAECRNTSSGGGRARLAPLPARAPPGKASAAPDLLGPPARLRGGLCSGEAAAPLTDGPSTTPAGWALSFLPCASAFASASAVGAPRSAFGMLVAHPSSHGCLPFRSPASAPLCRMLGPPLAEPGRPRPRLRSGLATQAPAFLTQSTCFARVSVWERQPLAPRSSLPCCTFFAPVGHAVQLRGAPSWRPAPAGASVFVGWRVRRLSRRASVLLPSSGTRRWIGGRQHAPAPISKKQS